MSMSFFCGNAVDSVFCQKKNDITVWGGGGGGGYPAPYHYPSFARHMLHVSADAGRRPTLQTRLHSSDWGCDNKGTINMQPLGERLLSDWRTLSLTALHFGHLGSTGFSVRRSEDERVSNDLVYLYWRTQCCPLVGQSRLNIVLCCISSTTLLRRTLYFFTQSCS